MSHVADGDLHAYLDDALDAYAPFEAKRVRDHLQGCADCARRLEEERSLRELAGQVLGGADPGVIQMASLEELEARADATGEARERRGLSWRNPSVIGLGWAATIALALWTGYSVNDFAARTAARPATLPVPTTTPGVDKVTAHEQQAEPNLEFRATPETAGRLSQGGAVRGAAEAGSSAEEEVRRDRDRTAAARAERQAATSGETSQAEGFRRSAVSESRDVRSAAAESQLPSFQDALPLEALVVADVADAKTRRTEGAGDRLGELLENSLGRSAVQIASAFGVEDLPLVPGMELKRVVTEELPVLGRAVLVVHGLGNGEELEIWTLPRASDPDAVPASADSSDRRETITSYFRTSLPAGWSMTVRSVRDGYQVLRGPLSRAELDAVLAPGR